MGCPEKDLKEIELLIVKESVIKASKWQEKQPLWGADIRKRDEDEQTDFSIGQNDHNSRINLPTWSWEKETAGNRG